MCVNRVRVVSARIENFEELADFTSIYDNLLSHLRSSHRRPVCCSASVGVVVASALRRGRRV